MVESALVFIIFIIVAALVFDFLNGFHDSANSIATIVSTRTLKPQWAVLYAAFFNFIAFLFFKLKVADTIGVGMVDPTIITPLFIFSALIGAITWNIITWYYGIPSSSSHALIGGLLGVAVVKTGFHSWNYAGVAKVVASIFFSPMLGLILGLILMTIVMRLFAKTARPKMDRGFRHLQLFTAALVSLGHGGNDAQKTMGIIAVLLFSTGMLGKHFYVPIWVVISCNFVMALGTFFGGWRIIRTMGMKITKLQPVHGSCAELAGASTLFLATYLGIPVSTTHTIAGAIFGVGASQQASAVRWGLARKIIVAWIITLPASALVAGMCFFALKGFFSY